MAGEAKRFIGRGTSVSIGLVLTLATIVGGGVVWFNNSLGEFRTSQREYELLSNAKVEKVRTELKEQYTAIFTELAEIRRQSADNWRERDMENWTLRLQLMNPKMVIPDPRDPTRPLPRTPSPP